MRPEILFQAGDEFAARVRDADRLLREGCTVVLKYKFRGREMVHTETGFQILRQALTLLARTGRAEAKPKLVGRIASVAVSPFV